MPKVTFVTEDLTIDVPAGTTIQEAVEMAGSQFPFGCRHGSCGACRCIIEGGTENLNAMTEAERDLFENLTSVGKDERLGCQLTVQGDVKIRV